MASPQDCVTVDLRDNHYNGFEGSARSLVATKLNGRKVAYYSCSKKNLPGQKYYETALLIMGLVCLGIGTIIFAPCAGVTPDSGGEYERCQGLKKIGIVNFGLGGAFTLALLGLILMRGSALVSSCLKSDSVELIP